MWPEKVLVIEQSGEGNCQLLRIGLGERFKSRVITDSPCAKANGVLAKQPDIVFVCLAEPGLSVSADGYLVNCVPTPTVDLIWDLINQHHPPVHVMVPTELLVAKQGFTALDTLAMILSGVSGIWESNQRLAADPELPEIIETQQTYHRNHRAFLYGRPAAQLYDYILKMTNGSWPTTVETSNSNREETLSELDHKYCFFTALALAMLDVADMTLQEVSTSGLEKYAARLRDLSSRTGIAYAPSVLARSLRNLNRGWKERIINFDVKRRNEMPAWSREDGFPAVMPLIRGTKPHKSAERLYSALEELDFEEDWEPSLSRFTTVRKPIRNRKET